MTIISDVEARISDIQSRSNTVLTKTSAFEQAFKNNLAEIDDENITSSLTSMSLSISASYSITGGILAFSSAGNATTIDGVNVYTLATQVSQNTQDIANNAADIAALQQSLINLSDTVAGLANTA